MRVYKWRTRIEMTWRHARYSLWEKWKYGSLIDGEIGDTVKIYFPPNFQEDGAGGESMWAEKVDRDTYRLQNNGFITPVAIGDIVRVHVKWPFLEAVEVLERERRTVLISFDLPWPNREERARLRDAITSVNGAIEWGHPDLLSISIPKDIDPYETLEGILGDNARILEED